jgi:hypothetical protein
MINRDSTMSKRGEWLAHRISAFVENPVTNLLKGITLLLIGIGYATQTFQDDVVHKRLHVGQGLIIIGLFSILGAVPHLIGAMDAGERFLERRENRDETRDTE